MENIQIFKKIKKKLTKIENFDKKDYFYAGFLAQWRLLKILDKNNEEKTKVRNASFSDSFFKNKKAFTK